MRSLGDLWLGCECHQMDAGQSSDMGQTIPGFKGEHIFIWGC